MQGDPARILPHSKHMRHACVGAQVGEFSDSPFAGAGFQLSSADVLLEVPFDPHLDMLFVGEEILYSARLWTKGWDLFGPDMNLVRHHYNRCSRCWCMH